MRQTPAVALALAETLLREVIARNEIARDGMRALDGTVLAIMVEGPDISLFMAVDGTRLSVNAHADQDPQVRISGTPTAFLNMLRNRDGNASATAGQVEIQGSLGTARAWQDWLRQLDFDWEEWLASLVGDVAAHQLARALHGLHTLVANTGASLARDTSEFLRFESELLPDRAMLEQHYTAIGELVIDVDRAAARVNRLLQRANSPI